MKDTIASAASDKSSTNMGRDDWTSTNSRKENGRSIKKLMVVNDEEWDAETKTQPLSNLYQFNIIMSPSHDEEVGRAPSVVGEMLDFDSPSNEAPTEETRDVSSHSSSHSTDEEGGKFGDDASDDDESVLQMDLFEGVFYTGHSTAGEDDIVPLDDEEVVYVSSEEASITKRPAGEEEEEEEEEERSLKKPKTEGIKELSSVPTSEPVPKTIDTKSCAAKLFTLKPAAAAVISAFRDEIAVSMKFPEPRHPRLNRPNCLFVNHLGTRLNEKGAAEPVDVPSKNFARISSEESVSIKSKATASTKSSRTSSDGETQRTPIKVSRDVSSTEAPTCIPSEVRIVTPTTNKHVRSSRLEDIVMEEDDFEPIHHVHDKDEMGLDSNDLPYIESLTENAALSSPKSLVVDDPPEVSTPVPDIALALPPLSSAAGSPHMMSNMMRGQGGMPMNFNRPFPLLQRQAFIAGSYPMAHPGQAFVAGWPGVFSHPCMPFVPHMNAFSGAPASATSTAGQWQQNHQ
jgi:hypothetical protein